MLKEFVLLSEEIKVHVAAYGEAQSFVNFYCAGIVTTHMKKWLKPLVVNEVNLVLR